MKANYPVEYLASLLTADSGDTDSIAIFVAEAKRMRVKVLPPDVNESGSVFTVVGERSSPDGEAIRFGLSSIKNFGDGISEAIIAERKAHGPFKTLPDFLSRISAKNLNRKSLESLIKCGALDSLNPSRGTLLDNIEMLLSYHRELTAPALSQGSLFGAVIAPPDLILPTGKPVSLVDKLAWEKELLGIYVSGHPLDAHEAVAKKAVLTIAKIKEERQSGMLIILPILVTLVRNILTKGGEKMAFLTVEDMSDSMEAVVFPKLLKEHANAIVAGACLLAKGKVSIRNGEVSLAIEEIRPL